MIPFGKYIVWQCPRCGRWQGKQNLKWSLGMNDYSKADAIEKLCVKCFKCQKAVKFKNKKTGFTAIEHYWSNHPEQAKMIIQNMTAPQRSEERAFRHATE